MDSKKLRIGDWVEIIGCGEKYSLVQEIYIYTTTSAQIRRMVRVIFYYNYCIGEDEILPIPITSKFLEKNEFKKCAEPYHPGTYFWKWGEYEDMGLIYVWLDGSIHVRKLRAEPYELCELNMTGVKYVHELQHILEDCKFNIDIVV